MVLGSGRGSQYETHSFTTWGAGRGKELLHHHESKMGLNLILVRLNIQTMKLSPQGPAWSRAKNGQPSKGDWEMIVSLMELVRV